MISWINTTWLFLFFSPCSFYENTLAAVIAQSPHGPIKNSIPFLVTLKNPLRQSQSLPNSGPSSAPVAQLDRAPDYESGGRAFESLRVHQFSFAAALFTLTVRAEPVEAREREGLRPSTSSGRTGKVGVYEYIKDKIRDHPAVWRP